MSVVTDIVLIYDETDRRVVADLWLDDGAREQCFVDVTEAANAGAIGPKRKMLQLRIAATAVNGFDGVEQLAERIAVASWEAPENVLLLVKGEEEVRPAVWGFAGALYFGCVDEPRRFECFVPAVRS